MISGVIDRKMLNYDKICQQFGQFFNSEELALVLGRKADQAQVQKALSVKAAYTDIESCLKVIN